MADIIHTRGMKRNKNLKRKKLAVFLLMMSPGIVYLLINNYLPMLGMVIAFQEADYSKGVFMGDFIGLKNFEYLFRTRDALIITRNTLLYNAAFIVINLIVAVGLAVLLNEIRSKFFTSLYQSAVLLPYLISMVIVGYLVFALLGSENGLINNGILKALGKKEIMWYSEQKYWPVILTIVNTWKNAGYLCVVYYASIIGLDHDYYEAAGLDGASRFQQLIHITLPLIRPIIVTMTLLQIGRIFYSDFGLFYQVTLDSGIIQPVTNTIDTYVYRALMNLGDIGMASAAGVYQSIVGFVLVLASNLLVRRIDPENAMF